MRIGIYSPAWPPGEMPNGIVTYAAYLREALIDAGHHVVILTPNLRPHGPAEGPACGVGPTRRVRLVNRLNGLLRRKTDFFSYWAGMVSASMRQSAKSLQLDVIEMEESFGACAAVARTAPCPVVVKLHGPAFLTEVGATNDPEDRRRKIQVEGDSLRALSCITSPSHRTLELTTERYQLKAPLMRRIVNPLKSLAGPQWRARQSERKTLLFVGRFDDVKGGDRIVLAFNRLASLDKDVDLIFVGPDAGIDDGSGTALKLADYVRKICSADVAGRIRYAGVLPPREIRALRLQAAVTLIASRYETQPYTALEAMSQGCPVVAFDAGAIGEVITSEVTGLLAPSDDIGAYVAQVGRLLDDTALAERLGRAAAEYVRDAHAPERVASDTLAVYEEAIAMGRRR